MHLAQLEDYKKITIKWFISDDKILKISHIFILMPRKYHGKKHLQLPVWQPCFPSGLKPLLEWITDIYFQPLSFLWRMYLEDIYQRSAPFPISHQRMFSKLSFLSPYNDMISDYPSQHYPVFIRMVSDECQRNIR